MLQNKKNIEQAYALAQARYRELGIDTEKILDQISRLKISLHCWQGDDVGGFEGNDGLSGGGIQVTGNYPGKARCAGELRTDLEKALSLLPGKHKVNVHAIYAENSSTQNRHQLDISHFSEWISWAKKNRLGLDFNGSFFSHPMAASGFTLSSSDEKIRRYWINHAKACRKIAYAMARELEIPCICNIWIPDGSKDIPVDRLEPRRRLKNSLDEILNEKYDAAYLRDAVESKLFGIGSESYVVGSHEFYLQYTAGGSTMLCFDLGHFHPTESIADKISAILLFRNELLLHVSRGVRWDSDHVVILNDEILSLMREINRTDSWRKVHIALDYFDASINRIAAWAIGGRATLKASLLA
ncbi:MAG TPA: L-rhamnose isomerase, partial [Spirochaetia bacterium]|nr:L-rhamnose isomerase [Spirochaetia bacterium]